MNRRVTVAEISAELVRGIDELLGPGRRDGLTDYPRQRELEDRP